MLLSKVVWQDPHGSLPKYIPSQIYYHGYFMEYGIGYQLWRALSGIPGYLVSVIVKMRDV